MIYSQHFAKLKKEITPMNTGDAATSSAGPSTPGAPKTPTKRAASTQTTPTPSKSTASRKRKTANEANPDEQAATPTKRRKKDAAVHPSGLSSELSSEVVHEYDENANKEATENGNGNATDNTAPAPVDGEKVKTE